MVDLTTFGHLRDTYQMSLAIRRGDRVETRLIATTRPHPEAAQVAPSLEEAYLYLVGGVHAG
jgi:hypothetical protein